MAISLRRTHSQSSPTFLPLEFRIVPQRRIPLHGRASPRKIRHPEITQTLPVTNGLARSVNAFGIHVYTLQVRKQLVIRDLPQGRVGAHHRLVFNIEGTGRLSHVGEHDNHFAVVFRRIVEHFRGDKQSPQNIGLAAYAARVVRNVPAMRA